MQFILSTYISYACMAYMSGHSKPVIVGTASPGVSLTFHYFAVFRQPVARGAARCDNLILTRVLIESRGRQSSSAVVV